MKEIKAYVHRNRVADVIAALKASPAWTAAGKGWKALIGEFTPDSICAELVAMEATA